jgi:hypothetical protein
MRLPRLFSMNSRATLTKDGVVDQLMGQLAARRALTARTTAAYERLARHVLLGTTNRPARFHRVPDSLAPSAKLAA